MPTYKLHEKMEPVVYKAIKDRRVTWLPYSEGFAGLSVHRFTWGGFIFEYEEMFESPFSLTILCGEPDEEYLSEYLKVVPV